MRSGPLLDSNFSGITGAARFGLGIWARCCSAIGLSPDDPTTAPEMRAISPIPGCNRQSEIYNLHWYGVLAQLVERLNGIEEVRGSNPLGSSPFL